MSSYNISLTGGMYWMGITTNAPGGLSYWHYTETVNNGTNFFGSLDGYATWEDVANYGFFVDGAFSICTSTTPRSETVSRISTLPKIRSQVQDSLQETGWQTM